MRESMFYVHSCVKLCFRSTSTRTIRRYATHAIAQMSAWPSARYSLTTMCAIDGPSRADPPQTIEEMYDFRINYPSDAHDGAPSITVTKDNVESTITKKEIKKATQQLMRTLVTLTQTLKVYPRAGGQLCRRTACES